MAELWAREALSMPVAADSVTLSTVSDRRRRENPMPDLTESITVRSTADTLYRLVSDLPRMPEWSPECTRVRWSRSEGPVVSARFVGHNRAGLVRWFTFGRVVTADPGRRFTFDITFGPIPISRWDYSFTATGDGCTVTESWTDHRPRILKRSSAPSSATAPHATPKASTPH